MKHTLKSVRALAATLIAFGSFAGEANGALLLTFEQTGADVAVTGSGSLDLSGLTLSSSNEGYGFEDLYVQGSSGWLWLSGSTTATYDVYSGAGTLNVSGGFTNPGFFNIDFSDDIGIWGTLNTATDVYVSNGYTSTSAIDFSTIISDTTLSEIGMNVGDSQTVSWTDGAADSITFTAIPEPSSALLIGLAALGVAFRRWRTN